MTEESEVVSAVAVDQHYVKGVSMKTNTEEGYLSKIRL